MSDQHEGDPRDIEPEYASDGWASRRGYEIAMAWGDSHEHRLGQADDIAHEFRKLRDHMQQQIDALRQERDEWRQRHAECTTSLITADRRIERLRQELAALSAPAPEQGELLPCPFCGGKVEPHFAEGVGWELFCHACDRVHVGYFHSEREAIEFWNKRTPPAPAVPAIHDAIADTIRCALDETAEDIGMNPQFYADPQEAIDKVEAALAWLESRQHRAASDD